MPPEQVFARQRLELPPLPPDVEQIRSACFPEWYRARDNRFRPADAWVVTATHDGLVVGYVEAERGMERGYCYIREVAVMGDARRQGVGRRLILEVVTWLAAEGFHTAYVYPLEDEDRDVRARWFESMGFAEPDRYTTHHANLDTVIARLSDPGY